MTKKILPSDEIELTDEITRDVELLTEVFMQQKKDRDEITVTKSIFDEIVEFTGHEDTPQEARTKKGAKARAEKLTPEERSAIAKKAAESR